MSKVVDAVMRLTDSARMSPEDKWVKETEERWDDIGCDVFIVSGHCSFTKAMQGNPTFVYGIYIFLEEGKARELLALEAAHQSKLADQPGTSELRRRFGL